VTLKLFAYIRQHLSFPWLTVLCGALLAFYVSAYFDVAIESRQQAIFPIILVALWRAPIDSKQRLPILMVLAVFMLWLMLSVGPFVGSNTAGRPVFFAQLSDDEHGLKVRGYVQRYNEIARTYNLPAADLLRRNIDEDREANEWLSGSTVAGLLITGAPRWLRVVPKPVDYTASSSFTFGSSGIPADTAQQAQSLGLAPGVDLLFMHLDSLGFPLAASLLPEAFSVPADMPELTLHFLAWFAGAVSPLASEGDRARERAMRYAALVEAASLEGPWTTKTPLGVAYYMLATFDLMEALADGDGRRGRFDLIIKKFGDAAAYVTPMDAPEVFAAVMNNAAIAAAANAISREERNRAKAWFWKAMVVTGKDGRQVKAARTAFLNLYLLDQRGL